MRSYTLSLILLVSFFATGYCRYRCSRNGQACKPYGGYTTNSVCGERQLINTTTTDVSNTWGFGPNVCKTEYLYGRNAYRHSTQCYGYYCSYCKCLRSDICDVPVTLTKTVYQCCDGFTTIPVSNGNYYWYEPHSRSTLLNGGCPVVVQDNVYDCLSELGLTELQCLLEGTDLENILKDNDRVFTLFGLLNETITDIGLKSYDDVEGVLDRFVIEKLLKSADFQDGQSFETLVDDCFVHVTEIDGTSPHWNSYERKSNERIFISGSEIDVRDACIARNGIVHIVKEPVQCGNTSIAEIVESDADYSVLESLLRLADKLSFLDDDKPLLTLLAPTNEAFIDSRISLGYNLAACLRSNTDVLKKFLHYHIVCGAEFSSTLVLRDELETKACVQKRHYYSYYSYYYYYYFKRPIYKTVCEKLEVDSQQPGGIEIGDDGVILTALDIIASNGVIHEISLPLLIPSVDFNELCASFTGAVVLPPPLAPPPP